MSFACEKCVNVNVPRENVISFACEKRVHVKVPGERVM